jgi:DNA-binding MarR family transcriptional regulator
MALNITGEPTQGELGKLLALDTTTLTRTLRLLMKSGWIVAKAGEDRRQRLLRLTFSGRQKFQKTLPHWDRAQKHLQRRLGQSTWNQLGELLAEVTRVTADS